MLSGDDPVPVGVECGHCGGPVYFERCTDDTGTGHEWATASECQRCGMRVADTCPECGHTGTGERL